MKKLALFLAAFMLVTVLASPVAAAAEGGGRVVDPIISPTEPENDPSPTEDPTLPDPNDPDSPDTVTIFDGDVPRTYIKMWDPELEEWVYVPEDEIPLANMTSPQTGDMDYTGAGWTVLLAAAGVVFLVKRTKKDEAVG